LSSLDPAAYDRFGVVLFAPPDVVAAVDALKEQLPRSGQPDLPAHVTVKDSFVAPTDLDAIAAGIAAGCASARPFRLTTGPLYDYKVGDRLGTIGFTMAVEPPDAIVDLHRSLALALAPLTTPAWGAEDPDTIHPHMTIVQHIPVELVARARATLERSPTDWRFAAEEVGLVGRRGGVDWELFRLFRVRS
jgi:2'-5' RNA ligase